MREIVSQQNRLDYLFKRISKLEGDAELQAHFARYLCILVSGFLEKAILEIYTTYTQDKASPYVANYVATQLESLHNPNMDRILKISGAFNPEWRRELVSEEHRAIRDAIDGIVNTRNRIAHGEDTGISYVTLKDYYERAKKLIEIIQRQCGL